MALDESPVMGSFLAALPSPDAIDPDPLHVLIADETELIREGLKTALKQMGRALRVTEAPNWSGAMAMCQDGPEVDLLLIDQDLVPEVATSDLGQLRARWPQLRIVMVTQRESGSRLREALRHGVNGYLSKKAGTRLLVNAIQLVLDGGTYVSPEVLMGNDAIDVPSERHRSDAQSPAFRGTLRHDITRRLTARQLQVLAQLMKGNSNKVICRELGMAMGTVKSHIAAIFAALQVSSRTAAIAAVTQIDSPDRDRERDRVRAASSFAQNF